MKNKIKFLTIIFIVFVGIAYFGIVKKAAAQAVPSFSFSAGGDHGSTSNSNTNASLNTLAASGVNFHLGIGDMSYMSSGTETAWCDFVKSKVGSSFPFEIVSGNHESDGLNGLIDNFAACLPDRLGVTGIYGKEYYFDYPKTAPFARFIITSPGLTFTNGGAYNYTVGSSHYNWVSARIDEARSAGIPWVIVGTHKNCITMGTKSCEITADLMNLLLTKKVDLILQGHDHGYQRTKQLKCAKVNTYDPTCVVAQGGSFAKGAGSVFTIAANFGAGLYTINTADSEAGYFEKWEGSNINPTYGFLKVTVTPTELQGQFVKSAGSGNFTDSFVISSTITPGSPSPAPSPLPSPSPSPSPSAAASPSPSPLASPLPVSCSSALPTNTGQATTTFTADLTTSYKVWSRMMSGGDSSDSFWLQVDNDCPVNVGDKAGTSVNTWNWIDYEDGQDANKIVIPLTAGSHTIKAVGREPGLKLDRLFLTADLICVPTGTGDNCVLASPSPSPSPSTAPGSTADPVVMAVGDMACGAASTGAACKQMDVSQLVVDSKPAAFLAVGDVQYESGESADFKNFYEPSFGRVKGITKPAIGNHEYNDPSTTDPTKVGYWDYFNGVGNFTGMGGDRDKGYYSYNIGSWHIVALNSNCSKVGGCDVGSPQYKWLQNDLVANAGAKCTLAYFHHPLFASGGRTSTAVRPFWQLLYDNNAEAILVGHEHNYERFAPMDANGNLDTARGLKEFVVGTGGRNFTSLVSAAPNSELFSDKSYGVLKLTLHNGSYDWQFVPIPGNTLNDSGTATCHGAGASPLPTPSVAPTPTPSPGPSPSPSPSPTPTPASGGLTTLNFSPSDDATVKENDRDGNFGSSPKLEVDYKTMERPLLKFNVSGVGGKKVMSARLRLYVVDSSSFGGRFWKVLDNSWSEGKVTWANQPPTDGDSITSLGTVHAGRWYEVDLTSYITGDGTYSLKATSPEEDGADYSSKEGANPPQLVLTVQ